MSLNTAGLVADSLNHDQMSHSVVSDQDLHCLFRPNYPNTVRIAFTPL